MKNLFLVFHILLIFSIVGCTKDKGVYVGEEKDGKRHGQGTVTYSDGKKYEGEFKNVKKVVKEHKLGLMEKNMKENSRMGKNMVKEHKLGLMEKSM